MAVRMCCSKHHCIQVFKLGGGSAGGGGGCTCSCGGVGTLPIHPKRHVNCLTQRNTVGYVSAGISTSVCSCDRRSLDTQLCTRVIPDIASCESQVVFSVSLERDFHQALPPERVTSLSFLPIVPTYMDGCRLLSTAADDGCALATVGFGKFGTDLEVC